MLEVTMALWSVYLLVNLFGFVVMGLDKFLAIHRFWRIPEASLLLVAFAFGGVGCLLGGLLFHHKREKWKFRLVLPLAVVLNGFLLWILISP